MTRDAEGIAAMVEGMADMARALERFVFGPEPETNEPEGDFGNVSEETGEMLQQEFFENLRKGGQ